MHAKKFLIFLLFLTAPEPVSQTRTFPDTSGGIVVFTDQLNTPAMSEAQFEFAARHYAGSQKLPREAARHLREYNPDYLVLHYRLGQGLGYRFADDACVPDGAYIQVIEGDDWVQEWPAEPQEEWFYKIGSSRVFNCAWGYYLMDIGNAAWRAWWSARVIEQLEANENDGLFADSYSVPNYLGSAEWNPDLPAVDPAFEADWAARQHAFSDYIQERFAGRWKWIPNIGAWITSRDPSDYSNLDGAMIEGFATWGNGGVFDVSDWELQMNRILGLTGAGKILIAQTYPTSPAERMFALGSYLLIKGGRTYLNLNDPDANPDMMPEWYPEYGIDLGVPTDALPSDISAFHDSESGVYVRRFENGEVYVNPGDANRIVVLETERDQVLPAGGGLVPESGTEPGSLGLQRVSSISVPAYGAVVVLNRDEGCTLSCSAGGPSSGYAGRSLSFSGSATASGCSGSPACSWSFGDGGSASGAAVDHVYAAAGIYTWTFTASIAGQTCVKTGTIRIAQGGPDPVVRSLAKSDAPFRIHVEGEHFRKGIKVYLDGRPWPELSRLTEFEIILNGGEALKAAVPANTPTEFLFVNTDGGSAAVTWSWESR